MAFERAGYDEVGEDSVPDGQAIGSYEIGGVKVTVHLQRWRGRDSGVKLGPTFHLELERGGKSETLLNHGFSDWVVNEGDEWPTEGEIRSAIESIEPGLLDDTDSDADRVREE